MKFIKYVEMKCMTAIEQKRGKMKVYSCKILINEMVEYYFNIFEGRLKIQLNMLNLLQQLKKLKWRYS